MPLNQITQTMSVIFSTVTCFWVSCSMLNVWLDPMSIDQGSWVPYAVGLLGIEFLILHSSVFIAQIAARQERLFDKVTCFAGFALFYLLMGVGFAAATDSPSLLVILGAIMLARFIAAAQQGQAAQARERTAFAIVVYLGVVFATVMLDVPEFGVTHSVLNEVYPDRGSGVWERQPERAIAGVVAYFAIIGAAEAWWGARAIRPASPAEESRQS